MTIEEIKKTLKCPEYDFLRTDERLGNNIILLGLGGSHAYGTSTPTSDLDVRGIALNSKNEILLGRDFEQRVNEATDTVIYSVTKMIGLLAACNPNCIEILGLKPEHYLYVSPIGQEILDNRKIFLSKKAIHSFGGYANQQLWRLSQKAVRTVPQSEKEQHILNSIRNAAHEFPARYFTCPEDAIRLYIDKAVNEDLDTEIFMDINLSHYPLRDYTSMWNDMRNVVKEYNKVGKRNQNAATHGKLAKHMMHLIRLYDMCLDILTKEEIITYREAEHDSYMEMRAGKFLDENNQPTNDFWDFLRDKESAFEEAKKNTSLPDQPDMDKIDELLASINERIIKGEI